MNLNNVRPMLGEIYRPPTQNLNDENDYLCNVGLVILIRGHPSPNLPRLIAAGMAAIHGGCQTDYVVSQVTIAPYLIICPNMQIRARVVQRGVYSIPNTCTQFAVHEWRPRFGMGHDLCSHQVWVRITGLSLQAWTMQGITTILQEISHPLHILPFGREAGHFRDVTALISTVSPNKIPVACSYREDDYSVRIDILILASQLSQPGYFPPPPEDPGLGESGHRHFQQQHDNRASPLDRSSSSSSNNNPFEPTVDLSAWSPRSHRVLICSDKLLRDQPSQAILFPNKLLLSDSSLPSEATQSLTIFFGGSKILLTHASMHSSTTKDPVSGKNISWIPPFTHISLLTSPSPIPITFAGTLQKALHKETENRGKPISAPYDSPRLQYGDEVLGFPLNTHREEFMDFSSLVFVTLFQLYGTKQTLLIKYATKAEESPIPTQAQLLSFSHLPLSDAFSKLPLLSPSLQLKGLYTPTPSDAPIDGFFFS